MLIFRYITKEVFLTLVALTSILLLVFMSNQLVLYLNRAANGQIPGIIIMKLMLLELPTLLSLLIPLGFYMSLLLAYGRMYADSEMIVLQACGYGPNQLLKHSLMMASVIAAVVLIIMLWLSPDIALERAKILQEAGVKTLIQTILPGRFNAVSGGRQVFYIEAMNRAHTVGENVFLAQLSTKDAEDSWDILSAKLAYIETDTHTGAESIVLEHGSAYQGIPGRADYQVAMFHRYKMRIPQATGLVKNDLRAVHTADFWPLSALTPAKSAELQWRISVPLMVLTLTFVAVPLCRVNPRSGKYARLFPAIVIYMIYANFMFVCRNWITNGRIPPWLGVWWLHALVFLLGLWLLRRNRVHLS